VLSIGYRTFAGSIYQYREYLLQSITRDLRKKYKRTSLGYVWSMLNPLLMLAVLTVVFSNLLPRVEHYALYLFSAMLGWQYFSQTISESLDSIRGNLKIIEQVPIPKYMFVISIAASGLVNFLLWLIALVIVALIVGRPLPWTCLLIPFAFLPVFFMTLAISLIFSAANVFFEDVKHLNQVVMRAWYFLTPILYGPDMLPDHIVKWLQLNPMFYPINFLRDVIYNGVIPDLWLYCAMLAMSILLLGVALWFYRKCDDKFLYFV